MNHNIWPERLYLLDISRGIASLGVVFWHWIHFAYAGSIEPATFDRTAQPLYAIFRLFYERGGMGVAYFFLLSGFIFFLVYYDTIGKRDVNIGSFSIYRFSRLYPLHFLTLMVVLLLQVVYFASSGVTFVYTNNDAYHFVLNLLFVSEWGAQSGWSFNGPVWSVSVEIFLYFVFFFVAYIRRGGPITCLLISVVSYGIMMLFDINDPIFLGLSLFFLGGAVFYFVQYVLIKQPALKWAIYLLTTLFWLCILYSFYSGTVGLVESFAPSEVVARFFTRIFPHFILFPLTVSSLALVSDRVHKQFKSFAWLGDITYSVYLIHFPLQLIFSLLVVYNVVDREFYRSPAALLIFFACLLLISVFTFYKFEKPMQKLIRQRYKAYSKRTVGLAENERLNPLQEQPHPVVNKGVNIIGAPVE